MSILQGKAVPRNSITESEHFHKPFLVRNLPFMMREVCPRQKQTIEGYFYVEHVIYKRYYIFIFDIIYEFLLSYFLFIKLH